MDLTEKKSNLKKTLTTADKLRLKSEFDYLKENGTKLVGRGFLLVHAVPPDDKMRWGVICSRKFDKRAVGRNRARRLLWESFRQLKARIEPCHVVLIPRRSIAKQKQQDVEKEMKYLLKKAGLLHKEI